MRAFIVEDNPAIRQSLLVTLDALEAIETIGLAETEEEGTRWLARNDAQWDLAIVDLYLKEGSGLGVVKACRLRHPRQKVVVLSNHATPEIRLRCAQWGVDAVFDKGTEMEALLDYCAALAGQFEAANAPSPKLTG